MGNIFETVMARVTDLLYILPVILFSLTIHEYAHGYVAYRLGDPTAKYEGRLTLNPLRHIDPIGLILMILIRFGWAKPVRVNPMYFKNPKKGMMYTAVAGPVSNLILALFSGLVVAVLDILLVNGMLSENVFDILFTFFYIMLLINVGMAFFNLIPIYPLDGSRILSFFLPTSFQNFMAEYGRYIYIAFVAVLLFTDVIGNFVGFFQATVGELFIKIWSLPLSLIF